MKESVVLPPILVDIVKKKIQKVVIASRFSLVAWLYFGLLDIAFFFVFHGSDSNNPSSSSFASGIKAIILT
jgi:hypothetical protein